LAGGLRLHEDVRHHGKGDPLQDDRALHRGDGLPRADALPRAEEGLLRAGGRDLLVDVATADVDRDPAKAVAKGRQIQHSTRFLKTWKIDDSREC